MPRPYGHALAPLLPRNGLLQCGFDKFVQGYPIFKGFLNDHPVYGRFDPYIETTLERFIRIDSLFFAKSQIIVNRLFEGNLQSVGMFRFKGDQVADVLYFALEYFIFRRKADRTDVLFIGDGIHFRCF